MTDFWLGFLVGALALAVVQLLLFVWASMKVAGDQDEEEERLRIAMGEQR